MAIRSRQIPGMNKVAGLVLLCWLSSSAQGSEFRQISLRIEDWLFQPEPWLDRCKSEGVNQSSVSRTSIPDDYPGISETRQLHRLRAGSRSNQSIFRKRDHRNSVSSSRQPAVFLPSKCSQEVRFHPEARTVTTSCFHARTGAVTFRNWQPTSSLFSPRFGLELWKTDGTTRSTVAGIRFRLRPKEVASA